MTCVYVNSDTNQFWVIDYRIFDPDRDGRSKLDYLLEMWQTILYVEKLPFRTVLMDKGFILKSFPKVIN